MSNESTVSKSTSRRAVLRAGAHAAWAVPAVQVATMVPAMAHSGTNNGQHAHYSVTPSSLTVVSQGNSKILGGTLLVSNTGPLGSTVTLTLSGYKIGTTAKQSATFTLTGAGWNRVGTTNSWTRIFASGSSSSTATITVTSGDNVGSSTAEVTATFAYSGTSDQGPASAVLQK